MTKFAQNINLMVIQRWQSVFLLLTCILMGCFSFLSLGQLQTADYSLNFTTMGFAIEGEGTMPLPADFPIRTWYFFAISLTSAIIPLVNIFLFRNLPLQRKVCLIDIMFLAAVMAVGAVLGYNTFPGVTPGWSTLVCAPFLSVILTIMAWQRIGKDFRTIRDSYRIR